MPVNPLRGRDAPPSPAAHASGVLRQLPVPPPPPPPVSLHASTSLHASSMVDPARKAALSAHASDAFAAACNGRSTEIARQMSLLDSGLLTSRVQQLAQSQLGQTTGSLMPRLHDQALRTPFAMYTSAHLRPPTHGMSNGNGARVDGVRGAGAVLRRASLAMPPPRRVQCAPSAAGGGGGATAARVHSAAPLRPCVDAFAPMSMATAASAKPHASAQRTSATRERAADTLASSAKDTTCDASGTACNGNGAAVTPAVSPPPLCNGDRNEQHDDGGAHDGAAHTVAVHGDADSVWPSQQASSSSPPPATANSSSDDADAQLHHKPLLHNNSDSDHQHASADVHSDKHKCSANNGAGLVAAVDTLTLNEHTTSFPTSPPQRVLSAGAQDAVTAATSSLATTRRTSKLSAASTTGAAAAPPLSPAPRDSVSNADAAAALCAVHVRPSDADLSLLSMPSLTHEAASEPPPPPSTQQQQQSQTTTTTSTRHHEREVDGRGDSEGVRPVQQQQQQQHDGVLHSPSHAAHGAPRVGVEESAQSRPPLARTAATLSVRTVQAQHITQRAPRTTMAVTTTTTASAEVAAAVGSDAHAAAAHTPTPSSVYNVAAASSLLQTPQQVTALPLTSSPPSPPPHVTQTSPLTSMEVSLSREQHAAHKTSSAAGAVAGHARVRDAHAASYSSAGDDDNDGDRGAVVVVAASTESSHKANAISSSGSGGRYTATDGADAHRRDGAHAQEWLQVPGLFYLFANLVELHELLLERRAVEQQQQQRLLPADAHDDASDYSRHSCNDSGDSSDGGGDDSVSHSGNGRGGHDEVAGTQQQQRRRRHQRQQGATSPQSRSSLLATPSANKQRQRQLVVSGAKQEDTSMHDEALVRLRNRISYAVYEVRNIFLNRMLVTWSDKRLRSLVRRVVDAWARDRNGDAMDAASFELLDAISRDERGRVHYRALYRVWRYLGAAQHRQLTLAVAGACAAVALACVVVLATLGSGSGSGGISAAAQVGATIGLSVVAGVGVLVWLALTSLLLHHNAYADLTARFFRAEAMSMTTEGITRNGDGDDESGSRSASCSYHLDDEDSRSGRGSHARVTATSPLPSIHYMRELPSLSVTAGAATAATAPPPPLVPPSHPRTPPHEPPSQLTTRSVDAMRWLSLDHADATHYMARRRSGGGGGGDHGGGLAIADGHVTCAATTAATAAVTQTPSPQPTAMTPSPSSLVLTPFTPPAATTTAAAAAAAAAGGSGASVVRPRFAIPSPPPAFLSPDTATTTAVAASGNNNSSSISITAPVQPATRPLQQRQLDQDRENALLMSGINFSQHQHHVQQHQERVLRSSIILSSALPSAYGAAALLSSTTPTTLTATSSSTHAATAAAAIAAGGASAGGGTSGSGTLTTAPVSAEVNSSDSTAPQAQMSVQAAFASTLTLSPDGATPGSLHGGALSVPSPPLSLPLDTSVRNMISELRDSINVTALLYCADDAVAAAVALALWRFNFLIVRAPLDVLDAAYHRGSERFKVFLLHAPDLPEASPALRTALAWVGEKRPVYFFSSDVGAYAVQLPVASCLELPLSDGDASALLLAGLGIDELNSSVLAPSPMPFRVPAYMLGRRLGGGAYGNVFEVVMEKTGARCAVKRIYLRGRDDDNDRARPTASGGSSPASAAMGGGGGEGGQHYGAAGNNDHDHDHDDDDDAGPQSQLREIAQEVEIMSSLSHPNIVQYMFCERDDNCISIFMELCSGGSLGALIKSRGLVDADQVRRILTDIISAVAYLHSKRIVHRDLKPDNVLFRDGRAKVTDFGTAVHKRGDLRHIKGTFAYMAPEILLGESYGKACDVWSIGCIAAEVLAVQLPQHALGLPEMVDYYRGLGADAALNIDCSVPAVHDFLLACLQRNPHARQTAARLLEHEVLQPGNMPLRRWMDTVAERLQSQRRPGTVGSSYGGANGGSLGVGGGGGAGCTSPGGGMLSRGHMYSTDFGSDDTVSLKSSQVVGYEDH